VGTVARIIKKINLPDGGVNIFISTLKRFRIRKVVSEREPMVAIVDYSRGHRGRHLRGQGPNSGPDRRDEGDIGEQSPLLGGDAPQHGQIDHPARSPTSSRASQIEKREQQRILEIQNVRQRMEQVLVFIKKEQELLRVQKKIQGEINDRIEKNQREYFLREELKTIKEELGMTTDAKGADYQKFKERIDALKFEGRSRKPSRASSRNFP
jgi:ATP-dependent Lon protease